MSNTQDLLVRLGKVDRGQSLEEQFDGLFRAHYPQLVRTLTRIARNAAEAEELAAEAFCRLHLRYRFVRARARTAWVYRTGINLALDLLRSAAKRHQPHALCDTQPEPAARDTNALTDLVAAEERDRVRRVLARLSRRDAQLLILAVEAHSYRDAALILGIKPDSVYTLIGRAKIAFAREYRLLERPRL